ncbi:MAG: leucyl/phenylalanyl-tRNA--protein transferase [Treponema sp.]|nr:leucyl/phenylalanyl-tRNA--protein transferase [Treponema sp.]
MERVSWHEQLGTELYGSDFSFVRFPIRASVREGLLGCTEIITPSLVFSAYLQGIFPWYNEDDPVLWWSPDPRFVLPVQELHTPRSAARFLKNTPYTYTMDKAFVNVITLCANVKRRDQNGTWICSDMIDVYCELFERGIAHSVEAWLGNELAGGFYGVLIGKVFCGESMFTLLPNAGKSAFILFMRAFETCGGKLVDSQVYTENIARYGARNISRAAFLRMESELLPAHLHGDMHIAFKETARKTCRT